MSKGEDKALIVCLPDYDGINASFFETPFDLESIQKKKGKLCRCWAGMSSLCACGSLARNHQCVAGSLDIILGGDHLNSETDFNTFAEISDAILAALK